MTRFDLVPVDGGEPVHVPPGETVLGRGPFLRTHLNPCFIQTSLADDPRPLEKGQWHLLHHGDLFSLLPGQLIFQVEVVDEDPATPRYQQADCFLLCQSNHQISSVTNQEVVGESSEKAVQEEEKKEVIVAPAEPRKRVLPDWMMAAATGISKKPALTPKGTEQFEFIS
uniref:Zgc:165656 n=1 Tax=Salarias fasciatus TaxID=181472 RepID=A0A672I5H1_SALFA